MLRFFLSLLFCCSLLSSFSQNTSSVEFVIRNVGIGVDGHFDVFSINTDLNNAGELLSVKGEIKVASIKTGIESRDEHLLKADYFDVENHEYIRFQSKSISKTSNSKYLAIINLTIKGKTKEIQLPIEVSKSSNGNEIISNFEINRQDFKVGGGSLVMSKTVKINVVYYQKI